jgi:hypothetical protein
MHAYISAYMDVFMFASHTGEKNCFVYTVHKNKPNVFWCTVFRTSVHTEVFNFQFSNTKTLPQNGSHTVGLSDYYSNIAEQSVVCNISSDTWMAWWFAQWFANCFRCERQFCPLRETCTQVKSWTVHAWTWGCAPQNAARLALSTGILKNENSCTCFPFFFPNQES